MERKRHEKGKGKKTRERKKNKGRRKDQKIPEILYKKLSNGRK